MTETIRFILNGKPVSPSVDGDRPLLWVLRTDLGLTGTKYGCGEGLCGACTVIVDEEPVRSCLLSAKDVAGKKVMTIEGLAKNGKLHPLQEAFIRHEALQCGYCTSGIILQAYGLLLKNPRPDMKQIQEGLEDHLCRCGSHNRVVQAVQAAAEIMRGGRR